MRAMTLAVAACSGFGLATTGCGPDPTDPAADACAEGEVWVEDACLACGPAGGCDAQGPACRPACDACPDGYEPMLCL